ncbi:deoxynucleoside triphosphate triphosphohydrolase SAMHD1-like isoform X1 [Ruditapes philippinarum]|uniref:deoxynucleoside triphosphate triphosphohydrolase SAMHD1-like isoform X1 n=1 Tax=Ruditapes philippinarum TaxID=129788 RepID=UPI00295B3AE6|nr:deoxynucleoside triphosphate triphosphohydrolase SAMHD1-like isoform X1 [Ruditapes philippinarum]
MTSVRYGHMVIVIRHCGVMLTKELFLKRISDITPGKLDKPWTVDDFLKEYKKELLGYEHIKSKEHIFYPGEMEKAKVDEWDLSTFCLLLLEFCKLPRKIRQDILCLKHLRNKVVHFGGTKDIPESTYKNYIERMKGILRLCEEELNNKKLKSELDKIIENNQNIQQKDVEEGEKELKQWSIEDEKYNIGISIENNGKDVGEVKTRLLDYHMKFEENDRSTNIEISLSIGIGWQGEYKQSGELAAVQQDISSGTTSSPESSSMRTFRISIEKIRGDVREMGDPEFETAGSGSIIFKFTCSSVTSLIYLLDYFSGPIIQRRLLDMTMAIEEMIDDLVTLQVYVPSKVYEETIKTLDGVLKHEEGHRTFAYKREKFSAKIFNDPLYGQIELHPLCVKIIDTPQFQRLRYIKQLETVYLVYPGASHNRFEHSIGVCYLAGKLLRVLKERQPELDITTKDILCVEVAALCHDLGQGPFSHVFEKKFIPVYTFSDAGWKHEMASVKMFELILRENNGQLYDDFKRMIPSFEDRDIAFIKELIGVRRDINGENWPYEGRNRLKSFLYEVVANHVTGVDVDRWDYIARDSYMLGMENGFDHNRCIQHARVLTAEGRKQICYREKAAQDIYDMFYARLTLYRRAYQHKTHNIIGLMVCNALHDANDHISYVGENGVRVKMSDTIYDMKAYTHFTDDVIQKIQRSSKKSLEKSKATIERIVRRDFYKCICQTQVKVTEQKDRFEKVSVQENLFNRINQKRIDERDLSEVLEIDVVNLDYGSKDKDPVTNVWFFKKGQEDIPIRIDKDQVSFVLPDTFAEQYIRVYCSETDQELFDTIEESFAEWCKENKIPQPKGSRKPLASSSGQP